MAGSLLKQVKRVLGNPITRLTLSFLILGGLLYHLPLEKLWETIRNVSLPVWLLTVLIFITGHVAGAIKWKLLVNAGKKKLPFVVALRCHFAGLFANLFLPSLAGGDVVRAGLAIRSLKAKAAVIMGGILDRFLDTASLALIILLGAYLAPSIFSDSDQRVLSFVFILLSSIAVFGLLILILPVSNWLPKKLHHPVQQIQDIIRQLLRTPWRAGLALMLGLLMQISFVGINAFLGSLCGIHIPFSAWLLVWPLAKLSALLPISMGGLGVREAALAALLARLNIPLEMAVGVGLLWETVLVTGGLSGGAFYLVMNKTSLPLQPIMSAAATVSEEQINETN